MKKIIIGILSLAIVITSCKRDNATDQNIPDEDPGLTASTPVLGYGILSELNGIWNGPVTSTTALGSYPEWIVDFRPISAAQVSSKSELDSLNDIFLSVFIAKHENEYRICLRNGGGFAGQQRISYMHCDSVNENASSKFYRFSDYVQDTARAFANFYFVNDSLYLTVYTNRYNTVNPTQLHMRWEAKLQDTVEAQDAITHFNFPQKVLVKDFSTSFDGLTETVFYSPGSDPYPESQQPYLGQTTVNINYSGFTPAPGTKSFVVFTTQPLFTGLVYQPQNMKYRTRYVILPIEDPNYTFIYMHPDSYYVYVLHDADGNGVLNTGDHINPPLSPTTYTLAELGTEIVNITVNFTVP